MASNVPERFVGADQSSRDVQGPLPVDLFDQRMAYRAAETIVERAL